MHGVAIEIGRNDPVTYFQPGSAYVIVNNCHWPAQGHAVDVGQ